MSFVFGIWGCQHELPETDLSIRLIEKMMEVSPTGSIDYYRLPRETDYVTIPQDPGNPLSKSKVELGKFLFHETGIGLDAAHPSGMQTFSCASCHVASRGFKPGRIQGIADGGMGFGHEGELRFKQDLYEEFELDAQPIRPLSVLNSAFVTNTFWNGQFGAGGVNEGTEDLWGQSIEGTEVNHSGFSGIEAQNMEGLKLHRMLVTEEIADDLGYRELFDSAFPDYADPEERYSNETASLAISAYLRSLITNRAPFQEFFRNGYLAPTMSDAEKEGALLFFGKAGCVRCHNGPSFGSMEFHALGVNDLKEHPEAFVTPEFHKKYLGRGGFTQREEDMYKFKVPQLYNLKGNGVYFHGSSKSSIRAVVEYFNLGIPENTEVPESQISHFFHPLDLTEDEIDKLTLFIEESLYDPDIYRYVPEALPSNNCFPNADPISKIDLNCE
ncbi:MAG TPA: cytochrome c peroxidase [Saprospiraceae bacterium]|nr:cytochrome c peroxidase [Saprospiraceae bacterium]